jgi:pimeloyl-ACP methyl ester carboxylesterase
VADALLELAAVAGESRIPSWDPCYDGLKRERRMALPTDQREIFDVFAPPSTLDPLPESPALLDWVDRLTRTALAADPFLDPVPGIRSLPHPVHLLHGREDQLIPYTESLRLAERLSAHRPLKATVTGLFGHSSEHAFREATGRVREAVGFVRALARVLSIV